MFELLKKTNIDFIGKKYITIVVTGTLTLIGIFAIVQIATGKANLGIDFAGGTAIQLRFAKSIPLHDVRVALEEAGIKDSDLQDIPAEKKVMIRVKKHAEGDLVAAKDAITNAVAKKITDNKFEVDSATSIGPKVGTRLRADAAMAIVMSAIFILIYIAFRFKLQFGVGATVATFHDVLAVLAIFYVMGREINLIFVTALLTIAGYSLTDTVVVFDRIRENLKRRIKEPLAQVINSSINEVLSRTIVTSLTVFIASLALFLFGGEVIHDFSLAMLIGVIVGTYSSIFVASPILLLWKKDNPFAKGK